MVFGLLLSASLPSLQKIYFPQGSTMQNSLNSKTVACGLILGALLGVSSKTQGQEGTVKGIEPDAVATSLFHPPKIPDSSGWLEQYHSKKAYSEDLLAKSALIGESLDSEGREYFVELLNRRTKQDKENSLALSNTDSAGTQLIDNLLSIALEPVHPRLVHERSILLKGFIHELADPGELNQSTWSVCGTAVLYRLLLDNPSEAARLVKGLISPVGRCRLRDNSLLERAPFSLLPDATPGRSPSERLLMSALMERANGSLQYCGVCDSHFEVIHGNVSHVGLTNAEICVLYKALFNKEFSWMEYPSNSVDSLMSQLKSLTSKHTFTPASIRWNSSVSVPTKFRHPKITNEEQHESKVLVSQGSVSVNVEGSHHILVTELHSGRVFYRNSHGKTDLPRGAELSNPPRRVEDPTQGIESMTTEEFKKRIFTVYIEKD